jgi:hypothetical protein
MRYQARRRQRLGMSVFSPAARMAGLNVNVTVVELGAFAYAEREHDRQRGPYFTRV